MARRHGWCEHYASMSFESWRIIPVQDISGMDPGRSLPPGLRLVSIGFVHRLKPVPAATLVYFPLVCRVLQFPVGKSTKLKFAHVAFVPSAQSAYYNIFSVSGLLRLHVRSHCLCLNERATSLPATPKFHREGKGRRLKEYPKQFTGHPKDELIFQDLSTIGMLFLSDPRIQPRQARTD